MASWRQRGWLVSSAVFRTRETRLVRVSRVAQSWRKNRKKNPIFAVVYLYVYRNNNRHVPYIILFYTRRRHWPLVVQYRFVLGELRVAHGLGVFVLAVVVALDSRFAGHGGPRMVRTPLEPDGDAQQQQQFGQHRRRSRVITHIMYIYI